MLEIAVDAIEVVSHGHKLSADLDGRQPIVLLRAGSCSRNTMSGPAE